MRCRAHRFLAVLTVPVLVTSLAAATASTATARATTTAAAAQRPSAGGLGSGDRYYPYLGNTGYDVSHYRLRLQYAPATHHLFGDAKIWARTTQALSSFSLDLRHDMTVAFVLVDGHRARFTHPLRYAQELIITPRVALRAGTAFTVFVRYGGRAHSVTDPDGSPDGWITTDDGAFVADEPQGAPTWFPVNNTPRDKATYDVTMTVPKALFVAGSGHYDGRRVHGAWASSRYVLTRPVSSYLITATIGRFQVHTGRTPRGIPYLVAIDPRQKQATAMVLRDLPRMLAFLADTYGPYLWKQAGAVVDDADIGYALETVTRPLFDQAPDAATLVHELAHQWYGDDVTCAYWKDIWLNEGFAEFSSWLWQAHTGGPSLRQHLRNLLANPASDTNEWNPPPGNPGNAANVFADSVYDRGAATLEALRETVGNAVFYRIMRGWLRLHSYSTATVTDFTAYAARVAGRDLTSFFETWLYRTGKP